MANAKIDFKGAATKMAGHAAGAAAYTQLNKLTFMQNQKDPKYKGLITALIGYIAVPMIAAKMKLGGRGSKADIIQHVGEGMGMVGIMQAAGAFLPGKTGPGSGLFPTISGYEEDPISGLGMITEEDELENVSGYVAGYEENPVSGVYGDEDDDVVS